MTLTRIQALIAPLAAPVPPALLLGNEMYQVMILVGIPLWLALVAASIAVVGLEFSGALMCYMAVKSWRRRARGAMTLAIIGAIIYTGIVYFGIRMMPEQRAQIFAVMVFVTLVAYLGYALYASSREDEARQKEVLDGQLALMRERRLTLNAKTRLAKVEGKETESQRKETEISSELPPWLLVLPENFRQFETLIKSGKITLPVGITGEELRRHIPAVGTDRTGRNWLSRIKR